MKQKRMFEKKVLCKFWYKENLKSLFSWTKLGKGITKQK